MRVPAVDDHVARLKDAEQFFDHVVNGRARLHHQKDLARTLQTGGELFQRVRGYEVLSGAATVHEGVNFFNRAVVNRHGEALRLHVHHEIFAHHGESHKTDVRFFHVGVFDVFPPRDRDRCGRCREVLAGG